MTREIRTETIIGIPFLYKDEEIKVVYEDGVKVGTIREETDILGDNPRQVERDTEGQIVSQTFSKSEEGSNVEETYNSHGNLVSRTEEDYIITLGPDIPIVKNMAPSGREISRTRDGSLLLGEPTRDTFDKNGKLIAREFLKPKSKEKSSESPEINSNKLVPLDDSTSYESSYSRSDDSASVPVIPTINAPQNPKIAVIEAKKKAEKEEKQRIEKILDETESEWQTTESIEKYLDLHHKLFVEALEEHKTINPKLYKIALANYEPPTKYKEMLALAKLRDSIVKEGEYSAKVYLENPDPKIAITAKRALTIIKRNNHEATMARVGDLEKKTDKELYEIARTHHYEDIAVMAVERIKDKEILRQAYYSTRGLPAGDKAKEKFYERVEEQKKERGFFRNIAYFFTHPSIWEDKL